MDGINRIKFKRTPLIEGIEICGVYESSHRFPEHAHDDFYAISLMHKGGSYWHGDSHRDTLVAPGNIAVINPGQVHSGAPANGSDSTYRMIYINSGLFSETAADILEKDSRVPEFMNIVRSDAVLRTLYQELYDALLKNNDIIETETALVSFTARLMKKYTGNTTVSCSTGNENQAISRAKEILSSRLDARITLEETASTVALSRYHFLRTFKKHTGVSPHVFRIQQRINAARKLILEGLPFSEIALETGFTDQSHFTNQFKKYTGVTPKQYLAG